MWAVLNGSIEIVQALLHKKDLDLSLHNQGIKAWEDSEKNLTIRTLIEAKMIEQ